MNSPWGIIFNLIKETSLTYHDILWKVSWINIQMMLDDAPRFKSGSSSGDKIGKDLESEDDFNEFLKL